MNHKLSQNYLDSLPMINPFKNYWLMRTQSGDFYKEFVENDFVAIGNNEITLAHLHPLKDDRSNKDILNSIAARVEIEATEVLSDKEQLRKGRKTVHQLARFYFNIKKGDIIVIPSTDSTYFSIGEAVDDFVYTVLPSEIMPGSCPYLKRRKVNWIKTGMSRHHYNSSLYRFVYAHSALNNITHHKDDINNVLYDFHVEDGKGSLVLRFRKGEEIDAYELASFYSDMIEYIKDINEFFGEEREKQLNVKMSLNSPGLMLLSGIAITGLVFAGVLVVAGGEFSIKANEGFKFKTNGLLKALTEFLNAKQERKVIFERIQKRLKDFDVKEIEEIKSVLKREVEDPE